MVKPVIPALLAGVLVAAVLGWIGVREWAPGEPSSAAGGRPPISGTVKNFIPTDPGRPAPIDRFYDADGHEVSFFDFGGKVVLLNLWATWCVPCLQELPSLDRLQAQLGGADFQVVALSVDRRGVEAVRPYFAKLKIANLPIYVEPKNQLATALGLEVLPSTIIIDPHGVMLGRMIGAAQWDAPESLALIRHYIAAARAPPPPSS
jgi:thiol-disulfide isomerase/thioredoxin